MKQLFYHHCFRAWPENLELLQSFLFLKGLHSNKNNFVCKHLSSLCIRCLSPWRFILQKVSPECESALVLMSRWSGLSPLSFHAERRCRFLRQVSIAVTDWVKGSHGSPNSNCPLKHSWDSVNFFKATWIKVLVCPFLFSREVLGTGREKEKDRLYSH